MSFSRLLQKAPYYSPAAFSPDRTRQEGPSELARARRTKAARPLVDPYAALTAPEFDNFVDNVSSRIVNALTYEPNRDRRIRRGYADDEEYWMEMGGKPGEFVGNQTTEDANVEDGGDILAEPGVETVQAEVDADGSLDEVAHGMETDLPHQAANEDASDVQGVPEIAHEQVLTHASSKVDQPAPSTLPPAILPEGIYQEPKGSAEPWQHGLYPDLTLLRDSQSTGEPVSVQASNDIEIPSNSLYPSLSSLQADYTLQNTENEALQFDLLRQFTHGDYDKYTAPSQEVEASNMQSIEDLLSMAEKDAEEANEAIQHIREEDQREQELDDALLEEIEHVLSDQEMQVEEDNDKLALQATDETEETETDVSPDLPSAKQKSASREASDVISIGSTSEEEEEEEGEEDEAEEEEEEGIDLEEELEEEDESDALEMTPPPVQSQTSQPEPSRQLFGQLDAPVASQARYMSQKARRRMDEDDLRMSGFDEEDGMVASGSSDASEEYEREWQQFRRKAGRGQRAQDEQDAADRYFDDEAEGEDDRVSQGSSQEEEDESEDEENEPEGFTPRFSSQQLKAAKEEFEDQLSDEAVADEERQSQLLEAGLDERVPIPAFMKRDKETGEYDLRIGSSDDDDEQDEDDEMEEEDENADTEAVLQDTETDDLKIEVLEDEQLEVQIEEAIEVSASTQSDAVGTDETIITTKVSSLNGLDPSLVAGSASDDIDSQSIEDHLDLAKSEQSVSPGTAAINISGQQIDVNQILEASLAEMQPLLPNFSALPPLPDSLAEVADQLLSDSLDAAKEDLSQTLEKSIDDAFSTNESKDSTMVTPSLAQNAEGSTASRARSKSREPNTSAVSGTPRKSESVLFSSMAVSPEQFTLPRRAVTPSHAVDKNVPDRDSIQHDVAATPLPTGLTDAANQTHVSESEMSAGSPAMQRVEKDTLRDSTAAIIVPEEPVPASVTPGDESETSPRENVPSSQALQAQDSHILREDHRHEPPPPELQEEERFEHASAPQPVEEAMFGIDLTTDEMESHSVDGSKEREPPIDSPFTEDHHFEPPPPELQEVSDNLGGEDVLSEKEPLAGIDMTTDEMEVHSGDERAAGPVHQIGYKEEHLFEPAPLPSEQPVKNKEVEEVLSPAPDSKHLREATDEKSESASSMGAQEEKTATPAESAGLANTPSAPGPTESTAIQDIATKSGQPQNVATPKRTFNVIKPGLWDPSTPIRFGGQSLEAAVREAYYDPDRSANLQKTLGSDQAQFEGNPSNDESLKADTSTRSASNKGHARFEVEEIQENTDFIPVVSESPALGEATEKTETVMDDTVNISEDSRPGDDVVPARVSSPGIKQPDGSLTEAVQEADFIGDIVTDVLAEDSELPPLEPEVLATSGSSMETMPKESELEQSSGPSSVPKYEGSVLDNAEAPVDASELLSSSDDSDDDEHHVATSLLQKRKSEATTPARPRRGRSRTRRTPVASRKGKERAETEEDAPIDAASTDTGYVSSSSSEGENLIRVTSKRKRSVSVTVQPAEIGTRERAVTPIKDSQGRNIVTTVIVPGSPIDPSTPMDEMEVSAMLSPGPSRPRFHRHGASGSNRHMLSPQTNRRRRGSHSSRSSTSRTSAEPVSGSSPAPVHPEAEHQRQSHTSPGHGGSPIQTRSQCTYRKLMIPNPYLGSINTPGRRMSTRLARAAGEATNETSQQEFPPSFVFLVPGCVTADRKEQMQEGGIVDLGVASVEEEGSAMALRNNEENETGLHVEGLPDSVVQSLVRVVGLEMFREGDCEILSPLIPQAPGSPARTGANGTERKRRRESDMMSPPGSVKRLR